MNLQLDLFEILDHIASSPISDLYSAIEKKTNMKVALKLFNYNGEKRLETLMEQKFENQSKLHHECILPFLGHGFYLNNKPFIVTEFMSSVDLSKILESQEDGNPPEWWDMTCRYKTIYGIAAGLKYCARFKILHRDIKPRNIFIDSKHEVKVGDFGFSRKALPMNTALPDSQGHTDDYDSDVSLSQDGYSELDLTKFVGSPFWMAPEMIDANTHYYSFPIDVYSWGIIALQIINGKKYPYDSQIETPSMY